MKPQVQAKPQNESRTHKSTIVKDKMHIFILYLITIINIYICFYKLFMLNSMRVSTIATYINKKSTTSSDIGSTKPLAVYKTSKLDIN